MAVCVEFKNCANSDYKYNLFSFLPEQTFFIFRPAIKLTNLL